MAVLKAFESFDSTSFDYNSLIALILIQFHWRISILFNILSDIKKI